MRRSINLTGKVLGRLTVLERSGSDAAGQPMWRCKCSCGNEVIILGNSLRRGLSRSCGCLKSELSSKRLLIHGKTESKLFRAWSHLISRCNNPNVKNYSDYGGRGVSVCEDWRNNFKSFYDWAMSHGYSDELTIDRIDVNGNYEPANCRWVNMKIQNRNRRNNVTITFNGKTQCLSEWAEELGFEYQVLYMRLKRGWCVEKAFLTHVKAQ